MSNALLVIILTALFCSFCCLFIQVVLQHPKTKEQYLKHGSIMLIYKFFNMFCGKNFFLHSSIHLKHGKPSLRLYPRTVSKLDTYQFEGQDILFVLNFEYLGYVYSSLIHLISSDASDEIRYSWKQF